MDYKTRHEQFVTGYAGGPIWDIYLLSFICILSTVCYHFISPKIASGYPSYFADFIFNWAIILAATTIYARKLVLLGSILSITTLAAYALVSREKKPATSRRASKKSPAKQTPKDTVETVVYRPFLTLYRSQMMVLTITAILAVDFPIFPRAFVKTETWGTSLMDLGVGSFVFSMGIVSSRKKLKSPNRSLGNEIKTSIMQTIKVLMLGIIRFASVKILNYHEHVSEYGTHWNFFFTLGLLPLSFTFLNRVPCFGGLLTKAFILAFGYELVLKNTGLQEWALVAQRTNLISSNKEGIVSFIGYLAIFSFGYCLGIQIISSRLHYKQIIAKLGVWTVIFQILFSILRIATEPSRRIANLPYICWVVCFNSCCLGIFSIAEYYFGVQPSDSYNAINKYGETVFVLGNVLTGLINLTIETLTLSSVASLLVVLSYQAIIMVAIHLYFNK